MDLTKQSVEDLKAAAVNLLGPDSPISLLTASLHNLRRRPTIVAVSALRPGKPGVERHTVELSRLRYGNPPAELSGVLNNLCTAATSYASKEAGRVLPATYPKKAPIEGIGKRAFQRMAVVHQNGLISVVVGPHREEALAIAQLFWAPLIGYFSQRAIDEGRQESGRLAPPPNRKRQKDT